jgi:hypothetical protein
MVRGQLERTGQTQSFLLSCGGFVFAIERRKDLRFGHLVVVAIFILDGLVCLNQCVV